MLNSRLPHELRTVSYEFKIKFEFVSEGAGRTLPYEFKIDFEFVRRVSGRRVLGVTRRGGGW